MIDTIVLAIRHPYFTISIDKLKKLFWKSPLKENLLWIWVPKGLNDYGRYMPQIRIIRNGYGKYIELKMELSLSKLLYGHNFYELTDSDFTQILLEIQKTLALLCIEVSIKAIRKAIVKKIHFSKNIPLSHWSYCHLVISEFAKTFFNIGLDGSDIEYKNGGVAYKQHCNSYEMVMYDKIKEIDISWISPKRAMEEYLPHEKKLRIEEINKDISVVRFELRFNDMKTMQGMFAKAGSRISSFAFENLFKIKRSKTILNYYWDNVIADIPPNYNGISEKELFCEIEGENINKQLQNFGLLILQKNTTAKQFTNILEKLSDKRKTRTLINESKRIKVNSDASIPNALKEVKQKLEEFESLKHGNCDIFRKQEENNKSRN